MDALFLTILQMSGRASAVILAVTALRALLRRAPKKISFLLWSAAAFRLCCPVSFRWVFSLFQLKKPVERAVSLAAQTVRAARSAPAAGDSLSPQGFVPIHPAAAPASSPQELLLRIGAILWLAGMAAMAVYAMGSLIRLRRQLSSAVRLEDGVWQSERVRSPFILGLFRPRIYVPFGLDGVRLEYVLAHERYHLSHLDHVVKLFAFLLLTLHWFNPLVWLAYVLMGRDMEMRCDEAVLSQMGGGRKAYSMTLLTFAARRRFSFPGPLAFSENSVRERVRNALRWKKPRLWVTLAALAVCVLAVASCSANPKETAVPFLPSDGDARYLTDDPESMAKIRSILLSDSTLRELNRRQRDGKLFLTYLNNFSMDRDYARFTLSRDPFGTDDLWLFRALLPTDDPERQLFAGARDEFVLSPDTAAELLPYLREWTETDFLPLSVTLGARPKTTIHDAPTVARLYAGLPELSGASELPRIDALIRLGAVYNKAVTAVFYDETVWYTKEYTLWRTGADAVCRVRDADGPERYFLLTNGAAQVQTFFDADALAGSLGRSMPYLFGGDSAKGHEVPAEFWISSPVSSQTVDTAVTDPAAKAELYSAYQGIRALREIPAEDRASVGERQSGFLTVDFQDNGEGVSLWLGRKTLVVWDSDHTDCILYEMENGEEVYEVFRKYHDANLLRAGTP